MSDLSQKIHALQPIVRIGKAGLTPAIVQEIRKHLHKRKLIKVKFLKSSLEDATIKELSQKLATDLNAQLLQCTGFVVTYAVQRLPGRNTDTNKPARNH